jgi:hypothetical protein
MWHKHPTVSVEFSRVAELYPKLCILAGASGTYTACVCVIHQNIIFMVQGVHHTAHFSAKRKPRKNGVLTASVRHVLYRYTSCLGADALCKLLSTVDNF